MEALAGGELDAAAAERIVATAEGNPLFLEQLLAVRAEGEPTLPPSIEGVLAARIDRLEPHEREVLRHASLEGRRFHVRATAELLPAEERDTLDGRCSASSRSSSSGRTGRSSPARTRSVSRTR